MFVCITLAYILYCIYNKKYLKIYAIRIYNRLLTLDEMKHNQMVDNKRFNLGL